MKAAEAQSEFRKRVGRPVEQLTVRDGVAAMCGFYADERADGAAIGSDRDMLLYQWGINDFDDPAMFELSITRQINVVGESQPYRLGLTFFFQPSDTLKRTGGGNQWCRAPGDVPQFQQFIEASAGFAAVQDAKSARVELRLVSG